MSTTEKGHYRKATGDPMTTENNRYQPSERVCSNEDPHPAHGIPPFDCQGRSAVKITRRPIRGGQRVWFSCRTCGGYGNASGPTDATETVLEGFSMIHQEPCRAGERRD